MQDEETKVETTAEAPVVKRSRPAPKPKIEPKPIQLNQEILPVQEPTAKNDRLIHVVILSTVVLLGIAATQVFNNNGVLGDAKAKIHDLELQSQSYKDGIRDVRH